MINRASITKAAQTFAAKGQIDKAIAEWQKLLKEGHDCNVYNTVGDLYLRKKATREAIDAFAMAAAIFREDGFYLKAIALYKKILNLSPKEVEALICLAELNAEKGLIGNANENYMAAAELLIKEGSTEKAVEIYKEILKVSPSNINIRRKIADLYLDIGKKEESSNEYLAIALEYLERKEYEKAQEYFLRVLGFDAENVPSLVGLSRTAEDSGDVKQAYEYLNKAISFAPDDSAALFNYARLSIETDNVDSAKQALVKLTELDPSNIKHKKLLGTIYLKEGALENAWKELLPYIDDALSAKKWDEALELLGNFMECESVEEVKRRLVSAYKGKDNKDAAIKELRELAAIYENKKLPEDALQSYRDLLMMNPMDEDVQIKVKELEKETAPAPEVFFEETPVDEALPKVDEYIGQELLSEAVTGLEILKAREPENLNVLTRLRDVYIKTEDKEKAIGEFIAIAEIHEKKGDMGAKDAMIADANKLNPDDPRLVALRMLSEEVKEEVEVPSEEAAIPAAGTPEKFQEEMAEADFYAQQGLKDEAINLYKKLLEASPGNEEVMKKLKALEPGKEEQEEATTAVEGDLKDIFGEFKKGIEAELGDKDASTRYDLGIAYKEMGLLDDAIQEFKISGKDPGKVVQ
ncbi:MAG TPA: tetratricopeptide repeat protein, partial [Nitrospirae bacterium]|nr:tetratricopeptide repeat protein [Nitrospirota bacterium]